MTAQCLIEELLALGGVIEVEGGNLIVDAPAEALTPDRLQRLRAAKPAILAALAQAPVIPSVEPIGGAVERVVGDEMPGANGWRAMAGHYEEQAELVWITNPVGADAWRVDALRCRLRAGDEISVGDLPGDLRIEFEERAAALEASGLRRERAEADAMWHVCGLILRAWHEPLPCDCRQCREARR